MWRAARPLIAAERFRPPRVRDIATALKVPEAATRTTMKRLMRMGQVVEIAPDHFFLRETVAEMAAIAAEAVDAEGVLTAAAFRDRLDNGRKVAILILEFFDKAGITVRSGDMRRVRMDRLGLFGRVEGLTFAGDIGSRLNRTASPGSIRNEIAFRDRGAPIDPPPQHCIEGREDLVHLRLFVGKQIGRVHQMDDRGGVGLEHQQAAVAGFGAVDGVIVEAQTFVQRIERGGVAAGEAVVECGHGAGFLGAFFGEFGHAGVEVVHHPVPRDRHVAEERLTVDEGDAEFPVEPVGAAVVLERRDEEVPLEGEVQIIRQFRRGLDAGQAGAGVGIDRPDQARVGAGRRVETFDRAAGFQMLVQSGSGHGDGGWAAHAGHAGQRAGQGVAFQRGQEPRVVQCRARPHCIQPA